MSSGVQTRVWVGVGTNLGDREEIIRQAEGLLKACPGVKLLRKSLVYETEPVGGPPQGKHLNAVWELEVSLSAVSLLDELLRIERQLGRERSIPNAPRTMDLDILVFGNELIESRNLTVPHPRLHERFFVLKPLCDLEPSWVHPLLGKTAQELLTSLEGVPIAS